MSAAQTKRAWFITGTDTGIGKTRFACALVHHLNARGIQAVGMKPVAAGIEQDDQGRWVNDDVVQLRAASPLRVSTQLDNPYLLPEPLSPHLAAQRAGQAIAIPRIHQAFDGLRAVADAVVVEGAGGFLVPLSDTTTGADLAQALGLPVILVVGLRLGCLNHALLTQEAIASRGLTLAGWVANRVDPTMLCADENVATLRRKLLAPLLADWPYAPEASLASLPLDLTPLL